MQSNIIGGIKSVSHMPRMLSFWSKAFAKGFASSVAGLIKIFHEISKFDGTKRSCRDRLAGHNLRRRKVMQSDQEVENDNNNNKNNASYGKGTDTPMLQQWYQEFTN
ncbi:hypothetical protein PVK06_006299 [Gossypium arboreum]|uniref:SBP-type domain-containing protein n=1 Tax=Gossypium arboreum TaxID=29729 RepID=A0ABR0QWZ3_GOSAR|nr:hypothetical protein PVK06_006299 [Gossypium arboreum]